MSELDDHGSGVTLLVPFLRDGLRRGEACQYFAAAGRGGVLLDNPYHQKLAP